MTSIVLIYPFSPKVEGVDSVRAVLENFLQRITSEEEMQAKANTYSCLFDASRVLEGKVSLDTITQKLLKALKKQRPLPSEARDIGGGSHLDESQKLPNAPLDSKIHPIVFPRRTENILLEERPSLLFIAHSLGAWVVKSMLSQTNEPAVTIFDTLGIILLDKPGNPDIYASVVKSAISSKHWSDPTLLDSKLQVTKHLKSIDQTYQLYKSAQSIQQQRRRVESSESVIDLNFDAWLVDVKSQGLRKVYILLITELLALLTRQQRLVGWTRLISWMSVRKVKRHIIKGQLTLDRGKENDNHSKLNKYFIESIVEKVLSHLPERNQEPRTLHIRQAP